MNLDAVRHVSIQGGVAMFEIENDPLWREILVCPRDRSDLESDEKGLTCKHGHHYLVVDGIPVMLLDDVKQNLKVIEDWLSVGPPANRANRGEVLEEGSVDPWVQRIIASTGGYLYKPLIGRLTQYPIPALKIAEPSQPSARLIDLGCNWGRWCVASARLGYQTIGIDPNFDAICAARRVARQLGVEIHYLVGDARYLPFRDGTFDIVYSYSVIQHFAKPDALLSFAEAGRVLGSGGCAKVQMPNVIGLRNLYHQTRRGFRPGRGFEVRYWTPRELRQAGNRHIGPSQISVDGFFTLNPQLTDVSLLPRRYRAIVKASEALRALSESFPFLGQVADSLWLDARKGD